ncbi:MAG TPA: EFR1 family ferrodoxin [Paludibacteraceae bacterium]|nr:EFR1 family ferrodoxin [Paludibacteraceae bacterium]HQB69222.1 EFR1 family ferrodoxin [Paludibacteraceae bacterium]HRS67933.1 EFR1 family ferrodoxin [Paludibacteraceae bacterium]
MICYFSGTGNSKWVAETVSIALTESLVPMAAYYGADAPVPTFELGATERIGFVFPIHSWGIPPLVVQFIEKLQISNHAQPSVFVMFTCGDECGHADRQMHDLLAKKGWATRHIYSVQMPNNYIMFPGFDVDAKPLEEQKKADAKRLLPQLIESIKKDLPIAHYHRGSLPYLKSRLIYPQFCKHMMTSKSFWVTDACTSCALCAKLCPIGTIELVNGKPTWKEDCTQCLSCIHHCPTRAIEYGKVTQKKGRYVYK